ncbi:MAG: hypothetical protein AB1297_02250 [bacterium]
MYKLYITNTFERKLKVFLKKHPYLEEEIERRLDLLLKNPYDTILKNPQAFRKV